MTQVTIQSSTAHSPLSLGGYAGTYVVSNISHSTLTAGRSTY